MFILNYFFKSHFFSVQNSDSLQQINDSFQALTATNYFDYTFISLINVLLGWIGSVPVENQGSVVIQISGISALTSNKRIFLSKIGMHALIAGTIASLLSATIIGIIA